MRVLSRRELAEAAEIIARGGWRQNVTDIAHDKLTHFKPADDISTCDCAKQRQFKAPEGKGTTPYDIAQTPYNREPMDAADNPACNLIVMVKPSRSGGTTIAENHVFKRIKYGPMGSVGWFLASDAAVKKYVDLIVKPMFELNPELQAKVGTGRSDNNDKSKVIAGHQVEWLSAADPNSFTNREPMVMVLDETDASKAAIADKPVVEIKARQKRLGSRKMGFVLSHPDKGWGSGVAAAWVDTSRGIFVMRCASCQGWAAAHATKHWPDTPEFRLHYERDEDASRDERLALAARTAGMKCPHCGSILTDAERRAMIDEALNEPRWMHRGQTLDAEQGIVGEMEPTPDWGFWVHGLMLKTVTAAELAKDYEAEVIKYATSRRSSGLKTYLARQLGEIYEGGVGKALVSSAILQKRARSERILQIGECPPEVRFIVASVDLKARQFDVSFRGFDLDVRSWWLDRFAIKQRRHHDGVMRDIRTRERIEDWDVLFDQVIDRRFPIIGQPGLAMPVAAIVIDIGDGNVTALGREFARRAVKAGRYWGKHTNKWSKVRLTQGSRNPNAEEVAPLKKDKDDAGKQVDPLNCEFSIGSFKLKELAIEYLAVQDGGPGQCLFADGIPAGFYDEYFNERLIDGKFEVSGPNESLDLFAMEIAGRLMLKPDRKDINWDTGPIPLWARPVPVNEGGGDQRPMREVQSTETSAPPEQPKTRSTLDKFNGLNG